MNGENNVSIFLTENEAELFKTFRHYQDIWEKVFKIRTGKAILHFCNGEMRKAEYSNQEYLTKENNREII